MANGFTSLLVYPTWVDCTISDDPVTRFKLLRGAGNYDRLGDLVMDENADHWPVSQTGRQRRELTLLGSGDGLDSNGALAYMHRHILHRPTIADGLVFGALHPRLFVNSPIVVLAEQMPSFGGAPHVLVLSTSSGRRQLSAEPFDAVLEGQPRFLACIN